MPPNSTPEEEPLRKGTTATVLKLSRFGIAWRVASVLVVFSILGAGQIINTNDWFPLGSLSQYSYARPLDSPTRSIGVKAINTEGKEVRVPLSVDGSGIGRAEIEGQAERLIAEPYRLEALARSWHGLHPDKPQFVEMWMERVTQSVKDGVPTGDRETEILVTWTVQGNYGEAQ